MIRCLAVRRLLSALIDRELGDERRANVSRHLGRCRSCRKEFERIKAGASLAKQGKSPGIAPSGVSSEMLDVVRAPEPAADRKLPLWWRVAPGLAVALVFVAAVSSPSVRRYFWPLQTNSAVYAFRNPSDEVRQLPSFELKTIDGRVVRSRDLEGRVTIIDFWAVWCGPCLVEIPAYNRFYEKFKSKGVAFIGVALDSGTDEEVRQAAKRFKMQYPIAVPAPEQLDAFGEIYVLPTTLILDGKQRVVKKYLGVPVDKHETMERIVEKLLE